jgi:hypothetical protein
MRFGSSILSPKRRQRLVAWLRNGGHFALEDGHDAEFRYDAVPIGALQVAERNRRSSDCDYSTPDMALQLKVRAITPKRRSRLAACSLSIARIREDGCAAGAGDQRAGLKPANIQQASIASFLTDGREQRYSLFIDPLRRRR